MTAASKTCFDDSGAEFSVNIGKLIFHAEILMLMGIFRGWFSRRAAMNRRSRRRLRRSVRLEKLEVRLLLHAGHDEVGQAADDIPADLSDNHYFLQHGAVLCGTYLTEFIADPRQTFLGDMAASAAGGGSLIPIASIPQLNSIPGAPATLFLNFQGSNSPTWWGWSEPNVGTTKVYDTDGDATTFNPTEIANILKTWSWVAEDFAPFNINVTTVQPQASARHVSQIDIGSNDLPYGGLGVVGGMENSTGANPVHGWSYTAAGSIVSHEAGHNMGLLHQSLYDANGNMVTEYYGGDGTSAPIMGSGGTELSEWWYGTSSDNRFGISYQNDAALISSTSNGFGYKPDDAGDSQATARTLRVNGNSVNGSGLIGRPDDVDYWRFTTSGGFVALAANVPAGINNLDLRLELRNTNNTVLAFSDLIDSFDATININLPAGNYFLVVSGHDYRSGPSDNSYPFIMGQYTINGTVPTPPDSPPSASLTALPV